MHKFYLHLVIAFCCLVLLPIYSCGDDEPIKLSKLDHELIDSLFFAQKDSLIKLTDTLCAERHQLIFDTAVDSIKAVRRAEIEFILGK